MIKPCSNKFPLLFFLLLLFSANGFGEASRLMAKLEAGVGLPYAVIGAQGELGLQLVTSCNMPNPSIAICGGIGTTLEMLTYSIGAKLYPFDVSWRWRPVFTLVYGPTIWYDKTELLGNSGVLNGYALFGGVDHDADKKGALIFTYGIGFILNVEAWPKKIQNKYSAIGLTAPSPFQERLKICAGIGYRFDFGARK